MTDAADDFDALFDEVSAQRTVVVAPVAAIAEEPAPALVIDDEIASGLSVTQNEADGDSEKSRMFERLGGIVRLLHDSLRELGYDKALNDASSQINDAQDRLEYIATLTEQAANKVLNTLDEGMPAQDVLAKNAKEMRNRWSLLFDGKLSVEEFKALAGDSRQFASDVSSATEAEKARLLEIMMAQDFQDITGQLIKKVVGITKTVEHELAQLLRDSAPPELREKLHKPVEVMQGPSLPSVAMDQDNVDDLLADLGF